MQQLKIVVLIVAVAFTLETRGMAQEPHPRSSELKTAPHDAGQTPPEPQRPDAHPRPVVPMVSRGYEGSEHHDGTHHGDDGHHNWHLKGGRH